MPYGFMTGPNTLYGYDPKTGKLYPLVDDGFGTYNLQVIQGGAEVVFELNQLIDHPGWQKAFLQYCRLTTAPKAVVAKDMTSGDEGADGSYAGPGRLAAYAYSKTRNNAFVARAVSQLRRRRPRWAAAPGGRLCHAARRRTGRAQSDRRVAVRFHQHHRADRRSPPSRFSSCAGTSSPPSCPPPRRRAPANHR